MKEIVDRILDGQFEYDNGSLDFSQAKIEIQINPGEVFEGTFVIYGRSDVLSEGFVFSSDSRMECITSHFSGFEEEISFVFHGKGMEEGDVLKGYFYIISNQGEYSLPFVVMISHAVLKSDMGDIKNLFHFTNLAKTNWAEAVRLFYSPDFVRLFEDNDSKFLDLYKGLSRTYFSERNMEEFLIAIHKKQKVRYLLDESKIYLDARQQMERHQVVLTRNGWGYTYLQVEVQGDFIQVDKEFLVDDDFLGNRCKYYYYVNDEKLHEGRNFGALHFFNTFEDIVLPICVKKESEVMKKHDYEADKKLLTSQIMEYYGAFRMKKLGTRAWLQHNYELVQKWIEMDEMDPVPKLYHAHLLMTENRQNEAAWVLDRAKASIMQSDDMSSSLWSYYLYLTTLRNREESYVNKIAAEIAETYKREPENWRVGWLLLYLSPEYNQSYSKKWLFIKRQFEMGCNSPVFYIEALLLMRLEPSLFMELGAFELHVLEYAAKHELITTDIMMQLHYLVPRVRGYSPRLLRILKKAYEQKEDEETLQNICTMLIKGGKQGTEYFEWYAAGIDKNLKITQIFEYYMYSIDLQKVMKLPKVVYMYFAYHNTLSWEYSAYLYASLEREKADYPELYQNEQFHIQEFVLQMIRAEKINPNLAYLYQQVIQPQMLDEELSAKLSKLLFTQEIHVLPEVVKESAIQSAAPVWKVVKKVILRIPHMVREAAFPIVNGRAYVPIYGEEFTLLFEDAEGNRYDAGVEFERKKLFPSGKLLQEIANQDVTTLGLQLFLCKSSSGEQIIREDNVKRFETLLNSDNILPEYKRELLPKLVKYYYDQDEMEQLDHFLEDVDPMILDSSKRGEVIRYLVIRELYDKALDWISQFGVDGVDPKTIFRMASKIIQQNGEMLQIMGTSQVLEDSHRVDEQLLLEMCHYSFNRGKYDAYTLEYLLQHFEGSTKEMRTIWKAAKGLELELHDYSEKLLVQMLFTGCFVGEKMDIFSTYLEKETSRSIEKAFLAQCSYDYFVKDKLTNEVIFRDIFRLYQLGEKIQKVCLLAYTKYYAENKEKIRESEKYFLKYCLWNLQREGICLPYFTEYVGMFQFMDRYYDKTIIEYKTRPGTTVRIHYMLESKEVQGGEYHTTEMKDVYGGVCCCTFSLFFGEKLLYYITEEAGDQEELTESGSVSRNDMGRDGFNCRFEMLNDIMISETLQDYETMNSMLMEYEKTDYMQELLFELQ